MKQPDPDYPADDPGPVMSDFGGLDRTIDHGAAATPTLLNLINPARWEGLDTPSREWALDGWIPARQATYLTGEGSTGKSLLGQQLATCMALGLPLLGIETRRTISIYLTCEDDPDELHRRQKAICEALGVSLGELSGRLHLVSLTGAIGNELCTFDALGRMATTPAWETLRTTVLNTGAGFLVLDNVAHLFAGSEIIRNQVAGFCGLLNRLAADADAAVLFIGHPNKKGDNFSGSTAWENQVRSRLFLDRPRDKEGAVVDPDARMITRAKANYARNGDAVIFRWHRWAFVREDDLADDDRAEIAASLLVVSEDAAFLRCLTKAIEERRATSASRSASNYAPRLFAAMPSAKGIKVKGFEAALQRLLHSGEIVNAANLYQRDNRAWVTGLGFAPTLAPTPARTLHEARTNDLPDTAWELHQPARTHPPYINIHGAASRASAPDIREEPPP